MANSEKGYIYTQENADLKTLQALLASAVTCAYVAELADARLVTSASDLPEIWPEGRAFGPQREVRWKQSDNREVYQIEVLTEDPEQAPTGTEWQRTAPDVDGIQARTILLWGEMTREPNIAPPWIEVRIPQTLEYPLEIDSDFDPKKRPHMLRVVIYGLDYTVGGMPVTTRWKQLAQQNAAPPKV
jgi:hypothetical protein